MTFCRFVTAVEIDTNRIKQVLKENWLGSNYSKCIWSNQQEVANQMKEKIMQQFMTGQPPKKIMQEMLRSGGLVETDIYKYNRLLRTETSYVVNRADLEVSKKLGIEKRKFVATLDSRTSSKCREQHNKIVYIEDTVIGVNTPPLHPFCRSIMVDYIPGLSDDREWDGGFQDFTDDFEKSKDYLKSLPNTLNPKTHTLERKVLESYFLDKYKVTSLPVEVEPLNENKDIYLTKSSISYILMRRNHQKALDYVDKIKEIIGNFDIIYENDKSIGGYVFYKKFDKDVAEVVVIENKEGHLIPHLLVFKENRFIKSVSDKKALIRKKS